MFGLPKKNLLANTGLVHLGLFAIKLGLHTMLKQDISPVKGPKAQVSVAPGIMMLWPWG